jgi:hypothetical protein
MLNYIQENIENLQELAKQKLNLVLDKIGYKLVTDIHNTEGVETRVYQWMNTQNNHCVQLIWDGKEDWFDLGEFQYTNNLSYLNANQILLVPIRRTKFINRKNYINRKINELIKAIKKEQTR